MGICDVGVLRGEELLQYSFPGGHPLTARRLEQFWKDLEQDEVFRDGRARFLDPVMASEEDLLLFHTPEYLAFTRKASDIGKGYLDNGDTPAFKGIFEAASYSAGSTLKGLDIVLQGETKHVFNPMGGLHHARRDRAGGFCVFNDSALAIAKSKIEYHLTRILYVDIDVHHGDGVFYEFYDDPAVFIADIHEDGRSLYPGTGFEYETGGGEAKGSKLSLPLQPGAGDEEFKEAFQRVVDFTEKVRPELIVLQAGADGLENDPLAHLKYTPRAHSHAASLLHRLAHRYSNGRILSLGGGGYSIGNVSAAWIAVVRALAGF